MCFNSHKSHVCVLCLLISSVVPSAGFSLHTGDGHKHTKGEPNHGNHTAEQHLKELGQDGNLELNGEDMDIYGRLTVGYFLDELMKKYGDGETMSFEGFEHLLYKLKLADIVYMDHNVECHRRINSSEFISFHSSHNHSRNSTLSSNSPCLKVHQTHSNHSDHDHSDHDHSDIDHSDHDNDHSDHDHSDHDHSDHNHENHLDHKHEDQLDQNHEDHSDHDHSDHAHPDHAHEDHSDHDHSDHDHSDHSDHDHSDHAHEDHSDHDHSDHSDHAHEDHSDHDHSDHSDHDHSDHSDHAHEDHSDHAHEDHSDHDHSDHSDHAHEDHSDHAHEDHSDHAHEDHSDHAHEDHSDHAHEDHSDHAHEDHSDHDHEDHSDHAHEDHSDHAHEDHSDHAHEDHSDHDHASQNHEDEQQIDDEVIEDPDVTEKPFLTYKKKRSVDRSDKECLPPKMLINLLKRDNSQGLTKDMFVHLCPALIYQMDTESCVTHHDDHDHHHEDPDHLHGDHDHLHDDHEHAHGDHEHNHSDVTSEAYTGTAHSAKVWGYSTLAIITISLVGLVGVFVVPIVEKEFYNHLLQFLVASAVGALAGDALLHLLPHAIAGGHNHGGGDNEGHDHGDHGGQGHESHDHDLTPVYKGLCGLFGIYFFFIMERLITIVTDLKRRKKKKNRKRNTKQDEMTDMVGAKLADSDNNMKCNEIMMSIHPNRALQGYADEAHSEHCTVSFDNDTAAISHQHGHRQHHNNDKLEEEEGVSIISGNEHGHGHSHFKDGMPSSVSALAWMLIMGDAIHNLSDGMAIGAAFANSITGGFSTSIAVFFHELPHEIGDFAVLLRAGMSVKQAILYSGVSSLFCFIGMCIGVALGNVHNSSLWIFAIVGGMFLYIALVDMLPELSSVATKKGENPFFHLVLQVLGLLLGGSIMLIIALYEENLMTILE